VELKGGKGGKGEGIRRRLMSWIWIWRMRRILWGLSRLGLGGLRLMLAEGEEGRGEGEGG
jgi:hypothetical protein